MCSTDFDPADIFTVEAVRARKRHRCDECHVDILPGEFYARARWLADGSWDGSNRCAACYFLCEAVETLICGDHGQILWGGNELSEEIDGYGRDAEFAWAGQAFAAIKDRVFEARR